MSEKNKVKYGLRNTHYAVITESEDGNITYAKPKRIPGAVSIKLSPEGDELEFWADDGLYYGEKNNAGYKGDLEVALIADEFLKEVLDMKEDAQGLMVENADAKPKKIALIFEFSGDAKQTRHILYNVTVARPNVEGKTTSKKKEPQTETLSFTATAHPKTRDIKAYCLEGSSKYDAWYNEVVMPAEG